MAMRNTFFSLALSGCLLSSCTLDDVLGTQGGGGGTSEDQVVRGLRAALSVGIDSSAAFAGQVNGYLAHEAIKILLPEEAARALAEAELVGSYVNPFAHELQAMKAAVTLAGLDKGEYAANVTRAADVLTLVGSVDDLSDSLIKYMNRAAEKAAPRSVPIFKSAITSMTIDDGLSLLNSPDSTAATAYLDGKTFAPLTTAYAPIVDSTLALVPLTQYWSDFRTTYNTLLADYQALLQFQAAWNAKPLVAAAPALQVDALKPVDNQPIKTESLGAWTTEKALTGLFYLVGNEEKDIRRDPLGYVKNLAGDVADLLRKVFGDIMEMGSAPNP
jgi:hypothetical protein